MTKFTEHEQVLLEELMQHPGYELLITKVVHEHSARLTNALARATTDWDETNRCRGELAGLAHFFPKQIRASYTQSEKP